jgi:S-adenosylmethionine uptake transporter
LTVSLLLADATIMASLHPRPAIPFMAAAAGIAFFALMDGAMKSLSINIGVYHAVLWRNVIGSVISGLFFVGMRLPWPQAKVLKIHLKRSLLTALMSVSFFWALARLPIAEGIGLSFVAPVIALYLAAVLLGERIGKEAIIASIAGVAGVLVIVGGKFSGHYTQDALWGTVAVLFSSCLFAYNLIVARQQAQLASPLEIAFFQNVLTACFLSFAAPWFLEGLPVEHLPLITIAAILAIISLLILSWAYARAEAQVLIPVEYTGFIWGAIFGWYYFDESVTLPTLLGTALIVAGSLVAARAKPKPPGQVEMAVV